MTEIQQAIYSLVDAIEQLDCEEAIYWARYVQINSTDLQSEPPKQLELKLPFAKLFKGFDLTETYLSNILVQLIWDSIKNEDYPVIVEKFRDQIIFGLKDSEDVDVNKLCLDIVFKLGFQNDHKPDEFIINCALQLIRSPNCSISALVVKYIKDLKPELIGNLMNPLISVFADSKEENSESTVIRFRFLELFFELSINIDNYDILFENFKNDIKTIITNCNDPLFVVNGLQTIQDCIQGKDQFDLLASEGIIDLLISLIKAYSSTSSNVISKILEVFTACALNDCFENDFIESNGLDRIVLDIQENCSNESVCESAIFCAAAFSSVSKSSISLLNNYGEILKHGKSAHQLAALNGLGIYFTSKCPTNSLKHELLLNLFEFFNSNFFDWLDKLCNSAFDEQKAAAYTALKSIVSIKENVKFVLDNSTLIANLLNRERDETRFGLQLKYEIIEDIYKNPELQSCFNEPLKDEFKKYLMQGIFYLIKAPRVAFTNQ